MNCYLTRSFDQWIGEKCGLGHDFTPKNLYNYQLSALKERAAFAMAHSRLYRERYAGCNLDDPLSLPLLTSHDIATAGTRMVCKPQTQIQRIVSMETTGTTGQPKRIYFSQADLELTIDFFAQGMTFMTSPGDKVFINMPGSNPDGLSDLLSRGLQRIGVESLKYGLISDLADAAATVRSFAPHCIVGIPRQILALAEYYPALRPRKVLLSADNIPDDLRQRVEELWQTEVFAHWGMRETGLGGAVECGEHDGYHIRHADLLVEIVDPLSGKPLPDGETGEIVVSTLTREAMPLLRYRTGDISRLISTTCACGSPFKRLDAVLGHKMMEVSR